LTAKLELVSWIIPKERVWHVVISTDPMSRVVGSQHRLEIMREAID
jgi:hypothetical protein